jgi:hypothetical protein
MHNKKIKCTKCKMKGKRHTDILGTKIYLINEEGERKRARERKREREREREVAWTMKSQQFGYKKCPAMCSQLWWHVPVIPAPQVYRQKDPKFKTSLGKVHEKKKNTQQRD